MLPIFFNVGKSSLNKLTIAIYAQSRYYQANYRDSDSDIVIRLQGKRFFNRKKVRVELENGPALAQGACSAQFHVIRRLPESAN